MTWWMLRILKGGNFTPDEVRLRRQIEGLKEQLAAASSEQRVEVLVKAVNTLVYQLNTLGTNAINLAVSPVSLETERQRLRDRRARQEEEARSARARAEESVAALHRKPQPAPAEVVEVVTCVNALCRLENPASARFCRKCGKILRP
jgi:predicted  nucleic acid-binding Zn-ribbon protein